jgi:hypothetical protein
VGRSGLGRDGAAEDEDSGGGADEEEGVSDVAQQKPSGDARGVEVTDDDSEEVDEDAFASRSEESDAAEDVAAARVDQRIYRSRPLPNRSIGGKRSYCTRKGRRCERTGATTADAHAI